MQSTKDPRILILGGGYAGTLSALRLAGHLRKTAGEITLVDARSAFTERIRLHQAVTGQTLPIYSYRHLLRGTGIQFRQALVTDICLRERSVTVAGEEGDHRLEYDYLIYALGSTSIAAPRADATPIVRLGGTTAAPALANLLADAQSAPRVLVVGGGLTGIEAATELATVPAGAEITLATRGIIGPGLSAKSRQYLRTAFDRFGITLREETNVDVGDGGRVRLNATEQSFDLVFWAGAFRPSPMAAAVGMPVDSGGRTRVDGWLRSMGHPNLYVVGDAAATPLRMACATAMPMGAYAADHLAATLAGRPLEPFRFGYLLQCVSLGRRDGLIQWVEPDDTPRERIVTGRPAAVIKEAICRYTIWNLAMERRFPGSYRGIQSRPVVETDTVPQKMVHSVNWK